MKTMILATGLLVATATGVVYYDELVAATRTTNNPVRPTTPPVKPETTRITVPVADPGISVIDAAKHSPRIDLVFVLDTTGSMSGMINAAKDKIWSIVASMANAQTAPEIRVGLVAYRDRGDAYITRMVDLTDDLDAMYAALMQFRAGGGGDGPESVNQALHEAVTKMSWTQGQNAYKVVFLVGDAPPHMDYDNDVQYPETIRIANKHGIVINTIQCGNSRPAKQNWQHIATLSQGQYFRVGQSGNPVAVATPYDEKMAALARELESTRLTYGSADERKAVQDKRLRVEKSLGGATVESRARRAAFNATVSGRANLLGDKDLVADVKNGVVKLDKLQAESLPTEFRGLDAPTVSAVIAKKAKKRDAVQQKISALSQKRQAFIKEKLEGAAVQDSLDSQIFSTVRRQAAAKGLRYDEGAVRY